MDWIYNCIVLRSRTEADNFGYLEAGNFAGGQKDQQAACLDKINTAYAGMPLTVDTKATVNNDILIDEENLSSSVDNITDHYDLAAAAVASDDASELAATLQTQEYKKRRSAFHKEVAAAILSNSSQLFLSKFLKHLKISGSIEKALDATLECKIIAKLFNISGL